MLDTHLSKFILNTPSGQKWSRIGLRRRAGIVAPLFSLYSRSSAGIADLSDLKMLIDWAHGTGNSIIQLLPMNELGSIFCPYDSVSSFALEPSYISIYGIPGVDKGWIEEELERLRSSFPLAGRSHLDYRVKKEKLNLLKEIFLKQQDKNIMRLVEFKEENNYWLEDFALFKVLKECHENLAWYDWEEGYRRHDIGLLRNFYNRHESEVRFEVWLQWLAFEQFKEVKAYAKGKDVLMKGDLPILVSRDSADAWAHPEFFKLDFAAGAPPDMYCAKGQRWGMPTYNWENIEKDGFSYLKEKLRYAQNFYDILRIDHAVGLFRIWSIPYNEPQENRGLNGFFDPREESRWGEHGRKILSVILQNTDMLLCAEDLGIIPAVCTQTLGEFGIPGNDVQRWVKDWNKAHDFLRPESYRHLSVAMLSTHDTTNWPAWWENEAGTVDEGLFVRMCLSRKINLYEVKDKLFNERLSRHRRLRWLSGVDLTEKLATILGKRKEEIGDFIDLYLNTYREKEKLWHHLGLKGKMKEKSDSEIIKAALKVTLASSAVFCIELLNDWLLFAGIFRGDPYECRINTPGTIDEKNWSLLIPVPLEELLKHDICQAARQLIASFGRA